MLSYASFEEMHAHVQQQSALAALGRSPSCLVNLRGTRTSVYVGADKCLWIWATRELLDRLGIGEERHPVQPGQLVVANLHHAMEYLHTFGCSGREKDRLLEYLSAFLPFNEWMAARFQQRQVETAAFEDSILPREGDNPPWFTANLRGIRHPFSFYINGSIWCFATERMVERLGLTEEEVKRGRWMACRQEEAAGWVKTYVVPSDQLKAEAYLANLRCNGHTYFPLESPAAPGPTMEVVNADHQVETILDQETTQWQLK